jgi:putative transposase
MSRWANCWEKAPIENFFAGLKKELIHREDYQTREEARTSTFEDIDVVYNRQRPRSTPGYKSPAEYQQSGFS